MSTAQQRSIDLAELEAALGTNVVRFVPPPRDEPQAVNSEWAASLDLLDEAAAFVKASEHRAVQAEERAEKVAFKAMEGLRSAQLRVEHAEAHAREIEQQTGEELRQAHGRIAELEAWAEEAEHRMRDAESRAETAESRAKDAEQWLRRLTDAIRHKFSVGAQPQATEDVRRSA